MQQAIYNPFRDFDFSHKNCFLSGLKATHLFRVFPEWLIERYGLEDKALRMLDESVVAYQDLRLPVTEEVLSTLNTFEKGMESAFTSGYESISNIDELMLFQWIGLRVYGIIYHEVSSGLRQQRASGEAFNFSQSLMLKFGSLQLMLQSFIRNVEFEGSSPWSVQVFKVDNPGDEFMYRDEINTLMYSIRLGNLGVVASLQDNGENQHYHRELLTRLNGKTLSLIQFEEVCARFFYSAYLFNRLPEYSVLEAHGTVFIEPMPLHTDTRPMFDAWQNKTYAQVLENFWKPWSLSMFEILKSPEQPLSYIEDQSGTT